MKVLLIDSSPRKGGNCDLLCESFAKGARERTEDVTTIYLRDRKIGPCHACYSCFRTGVCVQKDDMAEILKEIDEADVLVLASPTYFLLMNGTMKTLIDRLLPKWQDLGGKKAYVIVTGHDGRHGLERNGSDLEAVLVNLGNHVEKVLYGEGVWKKGEVLGTKAMEEAYRMGRSI